MWYVWWLHGCKYGLQTGVQMNASSDDNDTCTWNVNVGRPKISPNVTINTENFMYREIVLCCTQMNGTQVRWWYCHEGLTNRVAYISGIIQPITPAPPAPPLASAFCVVSAAIADNYWSGNMQHPKTNTPSNIHSKQRCIISTNVQTVDLGQVINWPTIIGNADLCRGRLLVDITTVTTITTRACTAWTVHLFCRF